MAENCNANITDDRYYTCKELNKLDFRTQKINFSLQLNNHDVLHIFKILRIVPGKRLVAAGAWHGNPVVAKIFFNKKPESHAQKELKGLKQLKEYNVPCAKLLFHGRAGNDVYVIVSEDISYAESVADLWQRRKNNEIILPELKRLVIELATQHVLGILQHDLHLKNFMISEKHVFSLDGTTIESFPPLLNTKLSIENLALLVSQFGVIEKQYAETLYSFYAKARGWQIKARDIMDFHLNIKAWQHLRWQEFEKKLFRNCTQFACFKEKSYSGVYAREEVQSPDVLQLIKNPESFFAHPDAVFLKKGRSATVVKLSFLNKTYVIKRYNIKSFWHRLRRSMRVTRARACWRIMQKLQLFNIPVPAPIAMVEQHFFGIRGPSYLIMEYVPGKPLAKFMQEHASDAIIQNVVQVFKNIATLEITHGDLKETNIIVNTLQKPILIDFDGALEHWSLTGLRKTWTKELQRFLENFNHQTQIKKQFIHELGDF